MSDQNEVPVVYVPASQIHKAVRNILVNEMGLGKESLGDIVKERVDASVQRRVDALLDPKRLDEMVSRQIGIVLGSTSWSRTPLADVINNAIKTHISQLVGSALKVELNLKHDPVGKEQDGK